MMVRLLSRTFRSLKSPNPNPNPLKPSSSSPSKDSKPRISLPKLSSRSWCVYLILSTNVPIKTYVGVTTDFPRRLRQHNGELKGGAKASHAGRPWVCACIIRGFKDQSEEFDKNVVKHSMFLGDDMLVLSLACSHVGVWRSVPVSM
ncbi:structure-specific endonuclease subunit SLX1 isoform X2 [Corylus avellana]|uniref:structure-specific endonuclease subunit SLX1 isoform X2 n=1 Tax=Corylus avellana TaxID=13451 RepID=UPI00286BC94F|nr:structure-specific endonuclease subunit SLX1 isoform X2 [Corylus avellana]